jgi:hypothetical protein
LVNRTAAPVGAATTRIAAERDVAGLDAAELEPAGLDASALEVAGLDGVGLAVADDEVQPASATAPSRQQQMPYRYLLPSRAISGA